MASLTLSSAFRSKYDLLADNVSSTGTIHIKVRRPPSQNLVRIRSITLDHAGIDKLDSVSCLTECCPRLEDLDLAHNAITSWNEVLDVLLNLPKLKLLNVSFNPLQNEDLSNPADASAVLSSSLTTLILNGTSCTWARVSQFLQHVPHLEELHLSCNQLEGPPSDLRLYNNIKRLHLNNNSLGQWSDFEAVGSSFPQLQVLVARCNTLKSVNDGKDKASDFFPNLTSLNLSGSALLNPGEFFSVVDCCPVLSNLRLQDVPLLDLWPSEMQRLFMVACTPSISCLNGSSVSSDERDKSERAFVRFYTDKATVPAWLQQRYDDLLQKHGIPQLLANVDLRPPTHVALTVQWEPESKTIPMQIPLDAKPREIARLVAKALGLDGMNAAKLLLILEDAGAAAAEQYALEELRYSHDRPLYRYHPRDGDKLLVSWR